MTKKSDLAGIVLGDLFGNSFAGFAIGWLSRRYLGAPDWALVVCAALGLFYGVFKIVWIAQRGEGE